MNPETDKPKILTPEFRKATPKFTASATNGNDATGAEQFRPVPKPSERESDRPPLAPTWFWCVACHAGIVPADGETCLACRMGWTPDAAEVERLIREYPKS